jgi:glycosyltransferase involved in cell wall biosynthesis
VASLLTASLIVRDEVRVLSECLESLQGVVDEVVVVDTGSVDDTVKVARRHGARVEAREWTGSFAEARNASLDLATGEWILYIDADERLAPIDRATVETLLADAPEVAFRVLLAPALGMTPYREYRLWRNDARIRFEGLIHEKVVPSIFAVADSDRRPIGDCELLLTHTGYEGDQTRKHRRNLELLRRQIEVEPDNLFNLHHLARALRGLGQADEAEQVLKHAVELVRAMPYVDTAGVLAYMDLVALRDARGEDVSALLEDGLARYPANWSLVWQQGTILMASGHYDEALPWFDKLIAVNTSTLPDQGPSYDARLFTELAPDARGLCLFRLGRYEESACAYAQAAKSAPGERSYAIKQQLALARARRAGPSPPGQPLVAQEESE